jgi:hypothetical protein
MIPSILHQTWKDSAVPPGFLKYMETWKRLHPGWDFKFWTDVDLANFVNSRCSDFSNLFHSYPNPIMRVDLARYLILREFGGVYADLDAEALASFTPLLNSDRPIVAYEPPTHAALEFIRRRGFRSVASNAIILSPANHAFWDHLLRLVQRCRSAANPLDATGPFALTIGIEQSPANVAPCVLPAHVFCPTDKFGVPVSQDLSGLKPLACHHWAGTWWKPLTANTSAVAAAPLMTMPDFAASATEARRFLSSIDLTIVNRVKSRNERVLVAVPVRDAAETIDSLVAGLLALRYPHRELALAFLEGDSTDDTFERLNRFARLHDQDFRRIQVIKRDHAMPMATPRWAPAMQRSRRTHIAKVRNELVREALQDEDWVFDCRASNRILCTLQCLRGEIGFHIVQIYYHCLRVRSHHTGKIGKGQ